MQSQKTLALFVFFLSILALALGGCCESSMTPTGTSSTDEVSKSEEAATLTTQTIDGYLHWTSGSEVKIVYNDAHEDVFSVDDVESVSNVTHYYSTNGTWKEPTSSLTITINPAYSGVTITGNAPQDLSQTGDPDEGPETGGANIKLDVTIESD